MPISRRKSPGAPQGPRHKDDFALWQQATRDIRPLERAEPMGEKKTPQSSAGATGGGSPKSAFAPDVPKAPDVSKAPGMPKTMPNAGLLARPAPGPSHELDAATDRRLRRGQLAIEGRLDLHGHTLAEGYAELAEFIANSREAGRRCLLVVTGRGDVAGERGVLRRNLPQWLAGPSLRPYVLGVSPAQPKHGGLGAFYVLLRKGLRHR